MVCTRENAPGVKEASVLDLSSLSDDLPKKDSSSDGLWPHLEPLAGSRSKNILLSRQFSISATGYYCGIPCACMWPQLRAPLQPWLSVTEFFYLFI